MTGADTVDEARKGSPPGIVLLSDGLERMRRTLAMPAADTFDVPPIGDLVRKYLHGLSVDPFARNKRWATHTNDLNPATAAEHHMPAPAFLAMLADQGIAADVVLFDPPYSPRQAAECYAGIGVKPTKADTQTAALYAACRREIRRLCRRGSLVLSFGWNTVGMGVGFKTEELLIVCLDGRVRALCVGARPGRQAPLRAPGSVAADRRTARTAHRLSLQPSAALCGQRRPVPAPVLTASEARREPHQTRLGGGSLRPGYCLPVLVGALRDVHLAERPPAHCHRLGLRLAAGREELLCVRGVVLVCGARGGGVVERDDAVGDFDVIDRGHDRGLSANLRGPDCPAHVLSIGQEARPVKRLSKLFRGRAAVVAERPNVRVEAGRDD